MTSQRAEEKLRARIQQLRELAHTTLASAQSSGAEIGRKFTNQSLFSQLKTSGLSFLAEVFGKEHSHYITFLTQVQNTREHCAQSALGIFDAVLSEINAGWISGFRGIVSGEIFSDFLEMGEHLLTQNYKDAAAVIIGGVLEEHLRELCVVNGISPTDDKSGRAVPKRTENLNTELKTADVYSLGQQKQVTAWLDLRNNAAHGHYTEYSAAEVRLMLQGVRDFLARNPT